MAIKPYFKEMDLGAIHHLLAPFAKSPEIEKRLEDMLSLNIITLGQGGGRKGAELGKFGWDVWMVNSAQVDMAEHDWIERKIVLTDPDRGKLEGTAKNATIGFQIANKNVDQFKKIAVETQETNLRIVTVALGGGQGNGSLPVALDWLIKVQDLAELRTERGNPTIMVIASLPSRDESNPDVWKNALSGLQYLQEQINQKNIGAVLPVDNELIRNYYRQPLEYAGKRYSALDYSNTIVARTLFEVLSLPLLSGQVAIDSAELLDILTTPGWLTVNRREVSADIKPSTIEFELQELFGGSEVFASLDVSDATAGAIAVITGSTMLSPDLVDQVKPITSKLLGRPSVLHHAVINTPAAKDEMYLLGLATTSNFPDTLLRSLTDKYEEETKRKEEKEARAKKEILSGFQSAYSSVAATSQSKSKKSVSLDDLMDKPSAGPVKKKVSLDDL